MPLKEIANSARVHRSNNFQSREYYLTRNQRHDAYKRVSNPATHMTKMALPSFPMDKTYLSSHGRHACAYVKHQKTYLKLKGFDVNSMYSVNRHHGVKPSEVESQKDKGYLSLSETDLPKLTDHRSLVRKPSTNSQAVGCAFWRPRDSTRSRGMAVNPPYPNTAGTTLLDSAFYTPGHQRPTDSRSQRLGKVLTRTHLRALLTQEQPVIPKAFFINSSGVSFQKT